MALTNQMNVVETVNSKESKKWLFPFILVTSLFFFWGFVHNLDPILIPHLRKAFNLTDLESSLIDSSVFIAYFVMALPAGYVMRKYGYKSGILIGLVLFGIGSILFVPAANSLQYVYFLGALFVIACGLTFLETAANPYITILGPPETATKRLNFAQSFNGLAAFIAPTVVGPMILSGKNLTESEMGSMSTIELNTYLASEAASVKMPYLILGLIIFVVAVVVYFTNMPDVKDEDTLGIEGAGFANALKSMKLRWGIVAQFFYVGAQVCVGSFFIKMATTAAGMEEATAARYLGFFGLAFMLGRFAGTFFMQFIQPRKLLIIYAIINIFLSIVAITGTGMLVVYTLIAIAFFMSIMFPTIFSMGIDGLGHNTKIGSSLIVMAIVGGALLPPVLGLISDATGSIQMGYTVPLTCFTVILLFAFNGHKANKA
ncbi:MAG: L-fucose:H+ symporter permease [Flavobacterium sp.]|uniref:L-fucose:H+ symporter permease n=1 Tax=Flavobacterium sp. TaxID=239 RepID=UPI001B4D7E95|nr:L-fucose:H+ symporter permease [Flavobacterium sp.]MBP6145984.1 L-fucose:H+ symporter permease [Flavobacterium sp.]MBP7182343.1 L-fucose:H+ symporter permease [Flavobacterium sp.]MBP7316930.1 L-fucose:H+ symporter permease [Flavobacterium sp.]HRL70535.1 L-fucose:H+ symporter permease [Flavobacterium sp.]HRM46966.1 L-fucose:H+ symporter permease [Flavobacterium sp.]